MAKPPRVVILTTRLPEDIWLINSVADVSRIEGIVLPKGTRYPEYGIAYVLKKRLPKLGILTLADQALLILYRHIFENRKDKEFIKDIFSNKPIDRIESKGAEILETNDINSDEVRNFILAKAPQIVIVSGTPLLTQHILGTANDRIINLHPGYIPQYRGRYGCFWPIYNKEPQLVGTTIHFVDKGIDTGAILLQKQVVFDVKDTLRAITYRQHKLGVELLVTCIQQFDSLSAKAYRKIDCPDKNYIAPGLSHYLKGKRWLRNAQRADRAHSCSE